MDFQWGWRAFLRGAVVIRPNVLKTNGIINLLARGGGRAVERDGGAPVLAMAITPHGTFQQTKPRKHGQDSR